MDNYILNDEEFREEISESYGKPNSILLKKVIAAGFKPIGITVMMCEETFIFKGNFDAERASKLFLPEGWWYGLSNFYRDYDKYIHDNYNGDYEMGPTVYWLDENYEPKK